VTGNRIRKRSVQINSSEETASGTRTRSPTRGQIEPKIKKVRDRRRADLEELTGWPWDARELGHFFSQPMINPASHMAWRLTIIEGITGENSTGSNDLEGSRVEEAGSLVDSGVQRSREICRTLGVLYDDSSRTRDNGRRNANFGRTLERLGIFRELREKFDCPIPEIDLVPPSLRSRLFEYLAIHGSNVCLDEESNCAECEVARFCKTRRFEVLAERKDGDRPKVVDLFCGAGGMSAGFDQAGFQTVCATDLDSDACRTFSLNHPGLLDENVVNGDITSDETINRVLDAIGSDEVHILVGGPPCQGFSKTGHSASRSIRARRMHAGFGEEDDERNYLFECMIEVAARIQPRVVLMENVPGMDAKRGDLPSFMQLAENMLQELGYCTAIWNLDAASYGIPQHRLRKFLVASRAPVPPALPEPDYIGRVPSMNNAEDLLQPVTINQAISDLPELGIDDGDELQPAIFRIDDGDRFLKHYLTRKVFPMRRGEKVIYNHRSRYNNDLDVELFSILSEGENAFDAVSKHRRTDLMRYRKDAFHDKYFRLYGDLPSRTIVSHLSHDGNGYIHPSQTRTLTPRECARLQSFPDNYVFSGSASSQWRQIGNAVPPLLAYSIARSLREHLERFFD
jgi:DNA (cytosine-5)-methyltransferase 1